MQTGTDNNYIIISTYSGNYPPRAIFIKSSLFRESSGDQLDKLLKKFPSNSTEPKIIVEVYQRDQILEGAYCCVGYDFNGQIDNSDDTARLIGNLHGYFVDDTVYKNKENMFMYYINDTNMYLSPIELYKKLLSTEEINGLRISVDHCFMISENPLNFVRSFCLRFFAKSETWISCEEIKRILSEDKRIIKIQPAPKNGKIFSGYGFIYLDNLESLEELSGTTQTIDNIIIRYD